MKNPAKPSKRKLLVALAVLAFVGLACVIVSSWRTPPPPSAAEDDLSASLRGEGGRAQPGERKKRSGRTIERAIPSRPAARRETPRETERNGEDEVDPRLRNLKVIDMPLEEKDPDEEPDTPEETARKRLVKIMTQPLKSAAEALPSFVYRGEMKVSIPTLVRDEEAHKAGKRFGESVEVTGSFTLTRDEEGNFVLHQETKSAGGNTKYDGGAYNGDLYYVDGKYSYVDAEGNRVGGESIGDVLTVMRSDGEEPLVRRNWIQIVKELGLVIGFDEAGDDDREQNYAVRAINPELQKKTVELDRLSGDLTVMKDFGVMGRANLDGAGTLRRGYMSGADVSYAIRLEITDIGAVSAVKTPAPR